MARSQSGNGVQEIKGQVLLRCDYFIYNIYIKYI